MSFLPVIACSFLIKIIINLSVLTYDKEKYEYKFHIFSNGLKFTNFFTIYISFIGLGSHMLSLGIKIAKIFESNLFKLKYFCYIYFK